MMQGALGHQSWHRRGQWHKGWIQHKNGRDIHAANISVASSRLPQVPVAMNLNKKKLEIKILHCSTGVSGHFNEVTDCNQGTDKNNKHQRMEAEWSGQSMDVRTKSGV